MNSYKNIRGYTLVELMIVVAIVGILAMIAIPTYNDYVDTSCLSTADQNLSTLANFEENYNLEMGTYLAGTHNAGDDINSSALMRPLHWDPADKGTFTYNVALNSALDGTTYNYVITVTGMGGCANANASFGPVQKGFGPQ